MAPELGGRGTISAAPYGSASILPITWTYIRMMGAAGLRRASLTAIASANYIARRLDEYFPVLYTGEERHGSRHECILDLRGLTKDTGVTVDDVAKRLADYGFHAPTMSFPVVGTLMVEPTESENLEEIDEFCEAMIAHSRRNRSRRSGRVDGGGQTRYAVLPTLREALPAQWDHPYSREIAVFPRGKARPKVWPSVRRIDGAHGDPATWSAPARRSKRSQATKACARRRSPPLAYEFENSDLLAGRRRVPADPKPRRHASCTALCFRPCPSLAPKAAAAERDTSAATSDRRECARTVADRYPSRTPRSLDAVRAREARRKYSDRDLRARQSGSARTGPATCSRGCPRRRWYRRHAGSRCGCCEVW